MRTGPAPGNGDRQTNKKKKRGKKRKKGRRRPAGLLAHSGVEVSGPAGYPRGLAVKDTLPAAGALPTTALLRKHLVSAALGKKGEPSRVPALETIYTFRQKEKDNNFEIFVAVTNPAEET